MCYITIRDLIYLLRYMQVEGDEVVKEDPSPPTDAGKADSGEEGPSGD